MPYFQWSFVTSSLGNGSDPEYEQFLMGQRMRKFFGEAAYNTYVMETALPWDWYPGDPAPILDLPCTLPHCEDPPVES